MASAPPDAELAGETGGETARTAVGRLAATVRRLRQEVWAAQAAADGRALLDLARGILIERLGLGPVEAARHLTALAEQAGDRRLAGPHGTDQDDARWHQRNLRVSR